MSEIGSGTYGLTVAQDQRHLYTMSASVTNLGSGTYRVGLCGNTTQPMNWDSNEWSYTTGLVFQT